MRTHALLRDSWSGTVHLLDAGERLRVGRADDMDLVPNSRIVARRHFEVRVEDDGRLVVRDLESTGGTYVDGARVVGVARARKPGQQIRASADVAMTVVDRGRRMIGAPSPSDAAGTLEALAGALASIHATGEIYGRVTSSAVLLFDRSPARLDPGSAMPDLGAGPISGNPIYLAPEVLRGERPVAASDVFALGCIAYELHAGRYPFEADAVPAMLMRTMEGDVDLTVLPSTWAGAGVGDVVDGTVRAAERGVGRGTRARWTGGRSSVIEPVMAGFRGVSWVCSFALACGGSTSVTDTTPSTTGASVESSAGESNSASESGTAAEGETTEATADTTATGTTGGDAGDETTTGPLLDIPSGETGNPPCAICEEAEFSYIWVANSPEGTVSKINTRLLTEEARFVTRPDGDGNPSRTSRLHRWAGRGRRQSQHRAGEDLGGPRLLRSRQEREPGSADLHVGHRCPRVGRR